MTSLSIIVPVYNKETYIEECIASILNQTYTDFELILVNDGSTDASGKKCEQFAYLDNRVKVVNQKNQGVSAARNTALELANGKYIGFADADDALDADMYEILIRNIEKHEADISICGVKKVFPTKIEAYYGTGKTQVYDTNTGLSALLNKDFARSVYDKVFKAELLRNIRFEGRMNEDTFFNFQAFTESKKSVFEDVIKYNYIIRDNSVSMEKFNPKYMDTLVLSKKMIEICSERTPVLVNEAKYFDLVANISVLNLILLAQKKNHISEYLSVVSNLKAYASYAKKNDIQRKHKYAILLFSINPALYELTMKLYCMITMADVYNKA